MDLNHLRLLAGVNENLSVEEYQIFLEAEKIKKGAFHRWLGKSEDADITDADIERGLKSDDPHVRKMAQFAKNMQHIHESSDSIKKGAFHKWLGKPEDEEITAADVEKGLKSDNPHVRKMAQFAKNTLHIKTESVEESADKDSLYSKGHQFGMSAGKSKIDRKEFDDKLHQHPQYKNGGTLATVFGRGAIAGWLEAREGEGVKESTSEMPDNLVEEKIAKVEMLDKEPNDTDQMEFDKERKGIDKVEGIKVKVPAEVKSSISKRLEELKNSIEVYDKKGYDDKSVKQNAVDALEKLRDHLNTGNQESYQQAQIFYGTLMSPIQDMLPARLVRFLHSSQ